MVYENVAVVDGQLSLHMQDQGGDPNVVLNALDVVYAGPVVTGSSVQWNIPADHWPGPVTWTIAGAGTNPRSEGLFEPSPPCAATTRPVVMQPMIAAGIDFIFVCGHCGGAAVLPVAHGHDFKRHVHVEDVVHGRLVVILIVLAVPRVV